MKPNAFLLAICVAALAWPCGLSARHSSPVRVADMQAIETGERAWGQAYVTGDVQIVERLLADDFVGVGPHGRTYDKTAVIGDVREGPHNRSDEVGPISIRFYGDFAIAHASEHEVGPAPEFKPVERVFTDSWVRSNGRWRIVAAEDLDPGLPTAAAFDADRTAILALRAASNRAIARHDMEMFVPMFADDAVFIWSNGTSAVGKAALRQFFARDFADPAFVTYVRTPERVSVNDRGQRAAEHGTWTAIKNGTRYGGDYSAHWFKDGSGWHVRGELYVKLYCAGPLCTP